MRNRDFFMDKSWLLMNIAWFFTENPWFFNEEILFLHEKSWCSWISHDCSMRNHDSLSKIKICQHRSWIFLFLFLSRLKHMSVLIRKIRESLLCFLGNLMISEGRLSSQTSRRSRIWWSSCQRAIWIPSTWWSSYQKYKESQIMFDMMITKYQELRGLSAIMTTRS